MFDTHCHLQDLRIRADVAVILERARSSGVEQMLCCATCPEDWAEVSELAADYAEIRPAFGILPRKVQDVAESDWDERLRGYLEDNPAACVGEIGLDGAVDPRCDELQMDFFLKQMRIAGEYERPVSVHCVRAWGRLSDALKAVGDMPSGIVMHSYGGSLETAESLMKYDVYFSFSAVISNPVNIRAAKVVRSIPLERMLVETDAPDGLPHDMRGGGLLNEPANLTVVVERIAELREISVEKVAEITADNAERVFGSIPIGCRLFGR